MKILCSNLHKNSFCAEQNSNSQNDNNKNPISKLGEREKLFAATAVAGLGVGLEALWYVLDGDFFVDKASDISEKLVEKNKKDAKGVKKTLLHLGAFGAVVLGFVGIIAALYTIFKTPEVMYKGNVNAFVKGKDMDVYSKSNDVEKELYNQMNEKAKTATLEEKQVLAQQYLKLKAAKNAPPDFVSYQNPPRN